MRGECRVRERLETLLPLYGLSIYGLSEHFEGVVNKNTRFLHIFDEKWRDGMAISGEKNSEKVSVFSSRWQLFQRKIVFVTAK